MKGWAIGKRITFGGGALCTLLALVGGIAFYCLRDIRADADQLKLHVMPGTINSAGFTIGPSRELHPGDAIRAGEHRSTYLKLADANKTEEAARRLSTDLISSCSGYNAQTRARFDYNASPA